MTVLFGSKNTVRFDEITRVISVDDETQTNNALIPLREIKRVEESMFSISLIEKYTNSTFVISKDAKGVEKLYDIFGI